MQSANSYLSEANYLENTLKYSGNQVQQVQQIVATLVTEKPLTFEECIVWARTQFEEHFNHSIQQLLFNLPKDATTSSGQPFWTSPKRAPDALTFDSNNTLHLDFIIAAANLRAANYGLKGGNDIAHIKAVADAVRIPPFTPKSGVKIQVNENEPVAEEGGTAFEVFTS